MVVHSSYREAIRTADWFDMELEYPDGMIVSAYALTEQDWLREVSKHVKGDGGAVSIRSYAVGADGVRTLIGSWTEVDATCQWKAGNPNHKPDEIYGSDPV